MKDLASWKGVCIVLVLFLVNEFWGASGSGLYYIFPFARLIAIPVTCGIQIICAFLAARRSRDLAPAAASALVLLYQFFGPPLRVLWR
jgi:hypothetical protein